MADNKRKGGIGAEIQEELERSINIARQDITEEDRAQAKKKIRGLSAKQKIAAVLIAVVALGGLWLLGGDPIDLIHYALTGTHYVAGPADGEARITVLASGQSDCSLIEAGEDVVMIDAGEFESDEAILTHLAEKNITEIDILFITHPHTDHYGSARDVLENVEVKQIIFTNVPKEMAPTAAAYMSLLNEIEERDIPLRLAEEGEEIPLDLGKIEILWAGGELSEDLNATSLVIRYELGSRSCLFMGDAEFSVEDILMERGDTLRADLLKAGHHGTRNATSAEFLKAVAPTYVAVTCEIGNDYGFPKEDMVQRVTDFGATLCRTDTEGDLTFLTDGIYFERSED